ncbi:MAG: hypothetical protein K8L99_26890 [Anaerolineae bacterium]|nr:hypothetical protein [Anaerolineae bacterium]
MKFNWKVLVALVVLIGALFWGIDSVRTRAYSGSDLNFGVGSGPITITNPADESVPAQLVGTGTRSFSVSSDTEVVSGSSTRAGTGRTSTQLFEFELPAGVTELMIVGRGSSVSFVADADSRLDASVQPLTPDDARTTLIITAVVALAALYYISKTTGHRWISQLRRKEEVPQDTQPTAVPPTSKSNVGRDGRLYSDS